ncbi:MAG: hypothetical protein IKK68_02895 [Paludibacteraceae bacterium]|nr:hypothetical protein [Paludibacteraceae bacterium]
MFKKLQKMGALASLMLAVTANAQVWKTDTSTKSVFTSPADANMVVGANADATTQSSRVFIKYGSTQNGLTIANASGDINLQLKKNGDLDIKKGLIVDGKTNLGKLTVSGNADFKGTIVCNYSGSFNGLTTSNGLSVGSSTSEAKNYVSISGANDEMKLSVSGYSGLKPFTFEASKFIFSNGKVGIGVTNPTVALDIVGDIRCQGNVDLISMNSQSINVENLAAKDITMDMKNAADYVFDAKYELKSLSEIEKFVNEHHHLPGMPSAEEMDANGVSVSKMSNLLLEKIEELTLHMIQLEKENAQLKAKFESLGK